MSKFFETDSFDKVGSGGEKQVWDAVKQSLASRDCLGYYKYPIFPKTGKSYKEPDILIVDKELGIVIIEVKSLPIQQIVSVNGHRWECKDYYYPSINPFEQGENQLYALMGYCNTEPELRRKIPTRVIVALPEITEEEWQTKGFDRTPANPPILFKDQLGRVSLLKMIKSTMTIDLGEEINEDRWRILTSVISGTPIHRKPKEEASYSPISRAGIINSLSDWLYEFDQKQEQIGKVIPPR